MGQQRADASQVIDAGTSSLDDRDVLRFIKDKRAQHAAENARAQSAGLPLPKRPGNYLDALRRHEEHLEAPERPFKDNPAYDEKGEYAVRLMQRLSSAKTPLVKVELLMILNHRPHIREFLCPLLEDMDSRYNDEEQDWIVDTVAEVLGRPGTARQPEGESQPG